MTVPAISVVIPVKNEAAGIAACLDGILSQTIPVREILVIDSGSTDGTQDIARSRPRTRVLEIAPEEFNHGDTRNLGVSQARGEFVIMTVGDARPVDQFWIENLLKGVVADDVVGVCGLQVVPIDKKTNPVQWFRPMSRPAITVVRYESAAAYDAEEPLKKLHSSSWDDVTALYRRDYMLKHPFRRTVYGEDMFFAIDALKAGAAIAYNPAAQVYHYHEESYQTLFKRTVVVALYRYRNFCFATPPQPVWKNTLRSLTNLIREDRLNCRERMKWVRYNYAAELAMRDGIALFRKAKLEGETALEALEEEFGATPPKPVKRAQGL